VLSLPEGVVTGANSGAVYSKLAQLANGAVYLSERDGEYVEVHDAKLAALEDLVEELSGQPLLVGYEFRHDLERIRARLGADTPTLSGVSERRITELVDAWNRGELPVLLAHPASAGHGLNLQGSAAAHVCWFSQPWDLDLYEQFIARVHRQGSTASHVTNHILRVAGTLDDDKAEKLAQKDTTQQGLLTRLNARIQRDEGLEAPRAAERIESLLDDSLAILGRLGVQEVQGLIIAAGHAAQPEEDTMAVRKLGFRNEAAQAPEAESGTLVRPKGWGPPPAESGEGTSDERMRELAGVSTPAESARRAPVEEPARPRGWGPPAGAEPDEQRAAIRSKIAAPLPEEPAEDDDGEEVPASVRALQAFGPGIVQRLDGEEDDGVEESATAATSTEPQQPKGWAAPAAHAPAETEAVVQQAAEGRSARDVVAGSDPWRGISARNRKALEAAGYASAFDAWEAGRRTLSGTVERFGKKGWEELEALYGGGETGAPQPVQDGSVPSEDGQFFSVDAMRQRMTQPAQIIGMGQGFTLPEDRPFVRINIEVSGLDSAALHALFSTLARRYETAEG
jgi:hypothetical protein